MIHQPGEMEVVTLLKFLQLEISNCRIIIRSYKMKCITKSVANLNSNGYSIIGISHEEQKKTLVLSKYLTLSSPCYPPVRNLSSIARFLT